MDTNDKKPLVSVRLMTYNHAPFIRKAMDGVMMQETNFPVEVVVGDDFSTDGTLDIIRECKDTENIRVKILEREEGDEYWKKRQEKGRLYNFTNLLENCTGKYIALLDGDDYWTDPKKLQKQVDFLEENSEVSACYTAANVLDESDGTIVLHKGNIPRANIERIISAGGGFFITASLVFRNKIEKFPDFFYNAAGGDHALILLLGLIGEVHKIEDVTTVYRIHEKGVYSSLRGNKSKLNKRKFNTIELLIAFNANTYKKYNRLIKIKISNILRSVISESGVFFLLRVDYKYFFMIKLKDYLGVLKDLIIK